MMKTRIQDETTKIITQMIKLFFVSEKINRYALENVAFGNAKPNEFINYDLYLQELKLSKFMPYKFNFDQIAGNYVNKQGKIINKDLEYFYLELFSIKINYHFLDL